MHGDIPLYDARMIEDGARRPRDARALEREALEHRLEALHPASWTWSLACCGGDPEEARETLQSAYLAVLEGRSRFGGRSALKAWLFAVIRRTNAARRRRERLRRVLLLNSWRLSSLQSNDDDRATVEEPSCRVEESERASEVRAALRTLSRRQRQVLELVFYHDLSVRAAAEVMGVTEGTASVHYDRGKKLLLKRLRAGGAR